jgi:hypothetical protein
MSKDTEKTSKEDLDAITFKNAAIAKIRGLQDELAKEKRKKKRTSSSGGGTRLTRLAGQRSFGEARKAAGRKRNA